MTIAKTLVGLFIAFVGQMAFANNWYDRGNGGFVLACADQPLVVLDVYEAQKRYFYTVVHSQKKETLEKAQELISRLKNIDPVRARTYTDWLKNFYQEAQILTDAEFSETPDLGLVKKPTECTLEQVIFQREPSRLNPARYIINEKLWQRLDKDNQAALIVHELIYRDFLAGMSLESTSERIRLFNAIILGNKLTGLHLQDYIQILQEDLHLSTYTYNGVTLFLGATDSSGHWRSSSLDFHDLDKVANGLFTANQVINTQGFTYFCMSSENQPTGGAVSFSPRGLVQGLRVSQSIEDNPLCSFPTFEIKNGNKKMTVSGSSWIFDEKGRVQLVTGSATRLLKTEMSYKGTTYERKNTFGMAPTMETYYRFDTDGNIRELSLGGLPCIKKKAGVVVFEPTPDSRTWTIQINAKGIVSTPLSACNK